MLVSLDSDLTKAFDDLGKCCPKVTITLAMNVCGARTNVNEVVAPSETTVFLAGNSVMTRPWSRVGDECFLELVETIRNADVSLTNLETVIHEFNGYAQAHCGGTYMASPPQIASELRWAGLDMIAHANNHSFDYGSLAFSKRSATLRMLASFLPARDVICKMRERHVT